jgi:DMSO/TMAO reductase YedYZ molybdopterin-dependent catalytic subunit
MRWRGHPGPLWYRTPTPIADHFVVTHFGGASPKARLPWQLRVCAGEEERRVLGLVELATLPQVDDLVTMRCFSNPLRPPRPLRRAGTARWTGPTLTSILGELPPPVLELVRGGKRRR